MAPGGAMKPIRQYMRDRRVAAALAAVALLAVGYRMVQSRAVSTPGQAVEAPPPGSAAGEPAADRTGTAASPGGRPRLSVPAGWSGPAWNWDRNPFLAPSAADAPGASGPAGGAADEYVADLSVPRLLGTVAGKGGGSAIFRGERPDGGDVLVPAGGSIAGWTLASVEPYRVFLKRGKETRIVELYRQ